MDKLTVGQILWFAPNGKRCGGKGFDVEITKIGKKWVYVNLYRSESRFLVGESLDKGAKIDGGNYLSPGNVFLSEDAYESYAQEKNDRNELFTFLQEASLHRYKTEFTTEQLRQAADILGFKKKQIEVQS